MPMPTQASLANTMYKTAGTPPMNAVPPPLPGVAAPAVPIIYRTNTSFINRPT
jgi:hypothetical protein